jgi:hypothetical protein
MTNADGSSGGGDLFARAKKLVSNLPDPFDLGSDLLTKKVYLVLLCAHDMRPAAQYTLKEPREWVTKHAAAIRVSCFALKIAVAAGRSMGWPLPKIPAVAAIEGAVAAVPGAAVAQAAVVAAMEGQLQAHMQAREGMEEVSEALEGYGFPVMKHGTSQRVIYPTTASIGETVFSQPGNPAIAEIEAIAEEVLEMLP